MHCQQFHLALKRRLKVSSKLLCVICTNPIPPFLSFSSFFLPLTSSTLHGVCVYATHNETCYLPPVDLNTAACSQWPERNHSSHVDHSCLPPSPPPSSSSFSCSSSLFNSLDDEVTCANTKTPAVVASTSQVTTSRTAASTSNSKSSTSATSDLNSISNSVHGAAGELSKSHLHTHQCEKDAQSHNHHHQQQQTSTSVTTSPTPLPASSQQQQQQQEKHFQGSVSSDQGFLRNYFIPGREQPNNQPTSINYYESYFDDSYVGDFSGEVELPCNLFTNSDESTSPSVLTSPCMLKGTNNCAVDPSTLLWCSDPDLNPSLLEFTYDSFGPESIVFNSSVEVTTATVTSANNSVITTTATSSPCQLTGSISGDNSNISNISTTPRASVTQSADTHKETNNVTTPRLCDSSVSASSYSSSPTSSLTTLDTTNATQLINNNKQEHLMNILNSVSSDDPNVMCKSTSDNIESTENAKIESTIIETPDHPSFTSTEVSSNTSSSSSSSTHSSPPASLPCSDSSGSSLSRTSSALGTFSRSSTLTRSQRRKISPKINFEQILNANDDTTIDTNEQLKQPALLDLNCDQLKNVALLDEELRMNPDGCSSGHNSYLSYLGIHCSCCCCILNCLSSLTSLSLSLSLSLLVSTVLFNIFQLCIHLYFTWYFNRLNTSSLWNILTN